MRVLIVDEFPLTRIGIRGLLVDIAPDSTVDEASSLTEALQFLNAFPYDIVLLEPILPDQSEDGVARVTAAAQGAPVLVLSRSQDPVAIRKALAAGARAYLPKTAAIADQRKALLRLVQPAGQAAGAPVQAPPATLPAGGIAAKCCPAPVADALTPQQNAVLPLLVAGKSNKEIARALNLRENTVKLHVRGIFQRLGVRNRTEAAIAARAADSAPASLQIPAGQGARAAPAD